MSGNLVLVLGLVLNTGDSSIDIQFRYYNDCDVSLKIVAHLSGKLSLATQQHQ